MVTPFTNISDYGSALMTRLVIFKAIEHYQPAPPCHLPGHAGHRTVRHHTVTPALPLHRAVDITKVVSDLAQRPTMHGGNTEETVNLAILIIDKIEPKTLKTILISHKICN